MKKNVCTCGHERCKGYKTWDTNPYAMEINDDYTEYFECEGTRYEASQDI